MVSTGEVCFTPACIVTVPVAVLLFLMVAVPMSSFGFLLAKRKGRDSFGWTWGCFFLPPLLFVIWKLPPLEGAAPATVPSKILR